MHYMESGVRQEVIPAYDEISQEYGYAILCTDCGNVDFMPECIFLDFVDECEIDLIMENDEDEEDLCQCDYCRGFRAGVDIAMKATKMHEECENCDCECGECCEVCEPEYFEKPNITINIENLILKDVGSFREIDEALRKHIPSLKLR